MKTSLKAGTIAGITGLVWCLAVLPVAADTSTPQREKVAARIEKPAPQHVAYLGVRTEPLPPAFWGQMPTVLEHEQGILVSDVIPDSPAAKAGIQQYDILLTFGDQRLYSPDQFLSLVENAKVGQKESLNIVRAGKKDTITVALGERTIEPSHARSMWHWPSWMSRHHSSTPATTQTEHPAWNEYDSLSLSNTGGDQYKAAISYEGKNGKIEQREFTGTLDKIRTDVTAQNDLPQAERDRLLRALEMPGLGLSADFPIVYYMPDGRVMWEFQGPQDEF